MTDEPTKAAIERAARLITASYRDAGFTNFTFDPCRDNAGPTEKALARYIDQVSETAKYVTGTLHAAYGDVVAEDAESLRKFILPDPEPDVLAELLGSDFELTWAGHEASADDLRTELAKRGYAITKTGEAGQ